MSPDETIAVAKAVNMEMTTTLSPAALVAGCRAMHECQGSGDPDSLIHHPAQKSWEEPTEPRWSQWVETVIEVHAALQSPSPTPEPSGLAVLAESVEGES